MRLNWIKYFNALVRLHDFDDRTQYRFIPVLIIFITRTTGTQKSTGYPGAQKCTGTYPGCC